jgi:hypothetical protein
MKDLSAGPIAIHRKPINVGTIFVAPASVTFGWQEQRQSFSVWYHADAEHNTRYIVLATGDGCDHPADIEASVVLPDGFHVFHLCRLK